MKNILVIGGGAMGSAFTIPSLENKNNVTISEPYSKRFIKDLSSKKKFHSALKIKLPKQLKFRKFSKNLLKENFDLIVIALSLPGIDFIGKELKVIIDKSTEKVSVGRTEFDSPEIDNIVHVKGKAEVGSFSNVKIQEVNEYELIGEIIKP